MRFDFDCVFYYVSDLERSISFYQNVLGFRLTSRDAVARFDLNGALFELVPSGKHLMQGPSNARLALKVEDMVEAIRCLQRYGVAASEPEQKPGGMLAFFHDPDGNEICLWQYLLP